MTFVEPAQEPEGVTPLDPDEAEGLLHSHVTTRGELDQLEQLNIAQGLMWMSARPHFDILEHGNIEELHTRLFGGYGLGQASTEEQKKRLALILSRLVLICATCWMMRDIGRSIKPLRLLRRRPAFTIALCKFIRFQMEMGGTLASVQMSICQLTLSTMLLIGMQVKLSQITARDETPILRLSG